jgi:RNA polymerase sigma-70 factor (ECF subfamily)
MKGTSKTPDRANGVFEQTRSSVEFLGEIYRQVWPELCRYVTVRYGGGPPEPEEVAQTAFAKFVAVETPQSVQNPRAFLFQTVRNILRDYHRNGGRRDDHLAEARHRAEEQDLCHISAEAQLLEKERFLIIAGVLMQVPTQHRRMVLLNRYEGLKCEEIGRRFGMSAAAVQKQIVRTLAKCAEEIEVAGGSKRNGSR